MSNDTKRDAVDDLSIEAGITQRIMTDEEFLAMRALVIAWKAFVALPVEHPDEQAEFRAAIHRAQGLIAIRVARRADPETWNTGGDR